jgi:hypothetical protein
MTRAEFMELPLWMTRRRFKEATGLSDDDLKQMRKAKELKLWSPSLQRKRGWKDTKGKARNPRRRRKHVICKYFKGDAARLCGFQF